MPSEVKSESNWQKEISDMTEQSNELIFSSLRVLDLGGEMGAYFERVSKTASIVFPAPKYLRVRFGGQ